MGPNYFDEHDRRRVERRLVARLEQLGYSVDLTRESLAEPPGAATCGESANG
ncbi:MAG TPA: hypothetical protein VNN62_03455 [Methylomirabilota bacterium]|nr:hypothetical protein [Methylomirabilota bacterium]